MISYVGPTFAKIQSDRFAAFLPRGEMSVNRISAASDVVQSGQQVRFALLEPIQKATGEWIASLSAVVEAEWRSALVRLKSNQKLRGKVIRYCSRLHLNFGHFSQNFRNFPCGHIKGHHHHRVL